MLLLQVDDDIMRCSKYTLSLMYLNILLNVDIVLFWYYTTIELYDVILQYAQI